MYNDKDKIAIMNLICKFQDAMSAAGAPVNLEHDNQGQLVIYLGIYDAPDGGLTSKQDDAVPRRGAGRPPHSVWLTSEQDEATVIE